jgi:transposase
MEAYLGIDVSKGYADFTLLDREKNQLEEVFQLDDTREGHDCLKKQLERMISRYQLTQVYCALESTGGFENNWYGSLVAWSKAMAVSVTRLNPSGVKNNVAAGLNRNVTDALSSRYIAEYIIAHSDRVRYEVQNVEYSSFRSLHKHINLQKKQQTQLVNQLKAILYSGFPELMRYCKNSVPVWVLEVLKKYPSAKRIAKLKPEQLSKINHVDLDKAQSIINKAKSSVSSRDNATTEFLIKSFALQIIEKQQLVIQHKKFLEQTCKGSEVTLLTSIPGVGNYSAAALMIEIETIHRFSSPAQLVCYFGVHPELKDSGDKISKHRMSKKGRASMRAILYMCAQSAVLFDSHIKGIYHKHRSKGKNHKQAIGVIMQKLLRIVWGVLKSKTEYNPKTDETNQNKKIVTPIQTNKKELISKRRFQKMDQTAPITNKQSKKRKVHSESQVDEIQQVRDHPHAPLVNI